MPRVFIPQHASLRTLASSIALLLGTSLLFLGADVASAQEGVLANKAGELLIPATSTIRFTEKFDSFCEGGAGRYLIFHVRSKGVLEIVDLEEGAVVQEIPVADDAVYAASREKLLIGSKFKGNLQKWALGTWDLEETIRLNALVNPPSIAIMGAYGDGPLLTFGSTEHHHSDVALWDIETMEIIRPRGKRIGGHERHRFRATVSADGQMFCGWHGGLSSQEFDVMGYKEHEGSTYIRKTDYHGKNGRWAIPGPDGELLFRYDGSLYSKDLQSISPSQYKDACLFPTPDKRFFLAVRAQGTSRSSVGLCTSNDLKEIATVANLESVLDGKDQPWPESGLMRMEPRIRFYPESQLLVCIPDDNNKVVIRKFEFKKLIQQTQDRYCYILSYPKAIAQAGETYSYQIETITSSQKLTYKLMDGPDGLTVTSGGEVRWAVPDDTKSQTRDVIVSVTDDNNKKIFHSYTLKVKSKPRPRVVVEEPEEKPKVVEKEVKPEEEPKIVNSKSQMGELDPSKWEKLDAAKMSREEYSAEKSRRQKIQNRIDRGLPAADPMDTALTIPIDRTIEMPAPFIAFCEGGSGKYLVFHLKEKRTLAIVDVDKGAIVHEVPTEDDILFAANREKLVAISPSKKFIEKWDLQSGKLEKSLDWKGDYPTQVAMGSQGDGPFAISCRREDDPHSRVEVELWDVDKMAPIPKRGERLSRHTAWKYAMTVSEDGKTFVGWHHGVSTQYFYFMKVHNNSTTVEQTPNVHGHHGRYAMPDPEGDLAYTYKSKVYDRNLSLLVPSHLKEATLYPTSDPRFFVAIRRQDKEHTGVSICTAAEKRELLTVKNLATMTPENRWTEWARMQLELRVKFYPEKKRLVTIPDDNNRVEIRTLDYKELVSKTQGDYFYFISKPSPFATVGTTYSYQVESLGSESVTYSKLLGPEGMTVSQDGKVTWRVEARPVGGVVRVRIAATKAGGDREFQDFEIDVQRNLVAKNGTNAKAGFVKIDDVRLELPSGFKAATPGRDGRMLVLSGDRLAILGPDGCTVEKQVVLDKAYTKIYERERYYVAIAQEPTGIFLLDKKTFEVTRSRNISTNGMLDLVIHPKLSISYATMKMEGDLPHFKFIVYDEKTGEGYESDEFFGNWLAIDPNGKFLVSAYSDKYVRGSKLRVNPQFWDVVPDYGNLEWLMRYRLDKSGRPKLSQVKTKAGWKSTGIQISNDGEKVSYLSETGYPQNSKNQSAWSTVDFDRLPVGFSLKSQADPKYLAYHPSLPMVASPGSSGALLFNTNDGSPLSEKLSVNDELAGVEPRGIFFSPDGKHLIVPGDIGGITYLHKFKLNLTGAELKASRIRSKPPVVDAGEDPESNANSNANVEPSTVKIPLRDLGAFRGSSRNAMTNTDVAKAFKESVFVVQSGDVSGTGFVVGRDGYIVTCAHCVPEDEVRLTGIRASGTNLTLEGEVLARDERLDIALLKVDTTKPLTPIRLAVGFDVATGMPVSVIGNPGVGDEILDFTMTEGIVSNARRRIEKVDYLQSSAAVNRGSSGSPMFDEHGDVIGMVVLKANIEGAGFALKVKDISQFLVDQLEVEELGHGIERSWFNSDGKGPLIAKFLGFKGRREVRLQRVSDDKEFILNVSDLSNADQKFLRMLKTKATRE